MRLGLVATAQQTIVITPADDDDTPTIQ